MCIRLTCRAKTYQALTEVTVLASRRHGVFVVFFKTFFYVAVHRPPSNCRHSTVFLSSLAAKAQIFQHCSDEPENCWYQVLYTYNTYSTTQQQQQEPLHNGLPWLCRSSAVAIPWPCYDTLAVVSMPHGIVNTLAHLLVVVVL